MNLDSKALLRASRVLIATPAEFLIKTGHSRAIAAFTYLRLTGVPPSEARAKLGHGFFKPQRPQFRHKFTNLDVSGHGLSTWDFVAAATQRRNLAKLAGVSLQEANVWPSVVSYRYFQHLSRLVAKLTCGQARDWKRNELRDDLCAVLLSRNSAAHASWRPWRSISWSSPCALIQGNGSLENSFGVAFGYVRDL